MLDGLYSIRAITDDKLVRKYHSGKYAEVFHSASRKLKNKQKNNASYLDLCGCCLIKLNETSKAVSYLKKAVQINPENSSYVDHLILAASHNGNVSEISFWLAQFENLQISEGAFVLVCSSQTDPVNWDFLNFFLKRADEHSFKSMDGLIHVANVYSNLNDIARSIHVNRRILKKDPKNVKNLNLLSQNLHRLGDFESARFYAKQVLEIDPNHAGMHRIIALEQKEVKTDDMNSLLTAYENSSGNERVQTSFALAKRSADLGDYQSAFQFYDAANMLEFQRRDPKSGLYSETQFASLVLSAFNQGLDERFNHITVNSDNFRNILIVGMPRSGTTLVEQILAAHSEVIGLGELEYLRRYSVASLMSVPDPKQLLGQIAAQVTGHYFSKTREILKNRYDDKKTVIVDKMPGNYSSIGFLLLANPNVKIVNLKRNPMAVAWSNYTRYFPAEDLSWTYNLDHILAKYRLYLKTMNFWENLFPGRIMNLDYELLTQNQQEMTSELLSFCDLEYEDACLSFHLNERPILTASAAQVRKKMYKGSSEAWKKYQEFLGDYPERFGSLYN